MVEKFIVVNFIVQCKDRTVMAVKRPFFTRLRVSSAKGRMQGWGEGGCTLNQGELFLARMLNSVQGVHSLN